MHGRPFYDYLNEHPVVANTMAEAMGTVGPPPVIEHYRPLADAVLHHASAAIDVSDGLAGDVVKLSRASSPSLARLLERQSEHRQSAGVELRGITLSATATAL